MYREPWATHAAGRARLVRAGIAPKSNFALAIVDGDEKFRENPVADARLGDIREVDVEIAKIGAGELDSRVRAAGGRSAARERQRIGRRCIDDGRNRLAVDGDVD